MLNVTIKSIMLNVVILSVVMLNVVAPFLAQIGLCLHSVTRTGTVQSLAGAIALNFFTSIANNYSKMMYHYMWRINTAYFCQILSLVFNAFYTCMAVRLKGAMTSKTQWKIGL